ncbi:hypothetical protein BsWGS_04937 [Bradybaena similaris]
MSPLCLEVSESTITHIGLELRKQRDRHGWLVYRPGAGFVPQLTHAPCRAASRRRTDRPCLIHGASTISSMARPQSLLILALLLVPPANAVRKDRDLRQLLTSNDYNRMLIANIRQPYEVIYPQQLDNGHVLDVSTRKQKIRHHGTHEHVQQLTIQLVLDGKHYKIRLLRNEVLLSSGIIVKHYEEDNRQILTKITEHCFYHGLVIGDEWSSVAVSTCEGIRGVVHLHNQTYIIQPLVKDSYSTEHPHVVFKASASDHGQCGNAYGQWSPFQDLYQEELIRRTKFANARRTHLQMSDSSQKLLRMALVLDNSMHLDMQLSRQQVIQYALDVANIVDLYYRELGFEVALTYVEFWNLHNHFLVDGQLRAVLTSFLHFKKNSLPQDGSFDAAFFLTAADLSDQVGIAVPASICTDRAVAVVKSAFLFEPQKTAAVLSHMTGHVLGVQHDADARLRQLYHEGDCVCKDTSGCMMSAEVFSSGSRSFSKCSRSDLDVSLNMGLTSCLWGAPQVNADFKQICGNRILERGEECDCGSPQFMSSKHMCRPRQSECDVPEFCDGQSGDCPVNVYIENGHPCAGGKGYCRAGVCPTVHRQCQDIWGIGAKGGHDQCYQRFNPTGNFNGHCGKDKLTGSYAKCQHSDVLCGLLHCEGGGDSPIYGSDKGFSTTSVSANDMEYECKTVHGPAMMDIPHMGLVEDGTKCGHHKVCLHNTCVQLPGIPVISCPSDEPALICSGHGVCAPGEVCLCQHGWEGRDCSVRSNLTLEELGSHRLHHVTVSAPSTLEVKVVVLSSGDSDSPRSDWLEHLYASADSSVTEDDSGTSSSLLISVLATVTAALFLATGLTFICYRRSYPLKELTKTSQLGNPDRGKSCCRGPACWGAHDSVSSEEDSQLPSPVVVVSASAYLPEKGILKKSSSQAALEHRSSTDSNVDSQRDEDSVGLYVYDDEDDDAEAEEICNIFHADSTDNLGRLQQSASFDFVIPPPPLPPAPPQFPLPDYYPSPALYRRFGPLELAHYEPYPTLYPQQVQLLPQHPVPTWRTALPPETLSPSQSRIVRLRNLTDYMQHLNNKSIIDLSPSPDELQNNQLSPSTSTSEDVRSSETDTDRMYNRTSHSDHSPVSLTSSSTQHTAAGPSFGSLSQYLLKRQETGNRLDSAEDVSEVCSKHKNLYSGGDHTEDISDVCSRHKNLYSSGDHTEADRSVHQNDLNVHLHGKRMSAADEACDMPPPMNPINIRSIFSLGHASRDSNQMSVNGDSSSFTCRGDQCKQRVSENSCDASSEQDFDMFSVTNSSCFDPYSQSELSRSQSSSPPSYSAVIRAGPNRIQLVPAGQLLEDGREIEGIQRELNRLLENLPRISAGSFERSPLHSNTAPSTPVGGPHSASKLLREETCDSGSPCIDRSLEEIPAHFSHETWSARAKRPISVAVPGTADGVSTDSLC